MTRPREFSGVRAPMRLTFCFQLSSDPPTSALCPPVGLNPTDPDREDEPASQIGTCFITDRFSLRFLRRTYNTERRDNERDREWESARGRWGRARDWSGLVRDEVASRRMVATFFITRPDLKLQVHVWCDNSSMHGGSHTGHLLIWREKKVSSLVSNAKILSWHTDRISVYNI